MLDELTIRKEIKNTKEKFLLTLYVNINDLVSNFGISFVLEYTSTNKKDVSLDFPSTSSFLL